jgi:hypothetical protein
MFASVAGEPEKKSETGQNTPTKKGRPFLKKSTIGRMSLVKCLLAIFYVRIIRIENLISFINQLAPH